MTEKRTFFTSVTDPRHFAGSYLQFYHKIFTSALTPRSYNTTMRVSVSKSVSMSMSGLCTCLCPCPCPCPYPWPCQCPCPHVCSHICDRACDHVHVRIRIHIHHYVNFMLIFLLVFFHAAWTFSIERQHGFGHAAWTWTCSINTDVFQRNFVCFCFVEHYFGYILLRND